MTDTEIISLMKRSPGEGRRALFDEYYSYVYAIAINILRDCGTASDAEECAVDVFASAIRDLDLDAGKSLKAFIGTIAKRRAIDMKRSLTAKTGRNVSIDAEELGELVSPERVDERAENSAMSEILLSKIEELGDPDSTIIIQKYFYERSSKEIGAIVGATPTAVRVRAARALDKLRGLLADLY